MIYTLENEELKVEINSLGAELWSVVDKRNNTEHIWQGDPSVWPKRAPTLFPHCGRLKESKYILEGKSYESAIHGFARDYEHSLIQKNNSSLTFLFSDSAETLQKYPFYFRLYTIFKLEGRTLVHTYEVENVSEKEMPFSIGYHTGYKLPFDDRHSVEDYRLVFEKEETPFELECTDAGLLSGEKRVFFEGQKEIPIHDKLFPASFVLTDLKSGYVSIVEKDTGRSIRVGIKGFPYVVFWGTPNKVRFVCVEPWFGLPDRQDTDGSFESKPGIMKLMPGKPFTCTMPITF